MLMTIIQRIEELNQERSWSLYELSKRADLAESTVYTWKRTNKTPSMPVLTKICNAYGISLYQFFNGIGDNSITEEQRNILNGWALLTPEQKHSIKQIIELFAQSNRS